MWEQHQNFQHHPEQQQFFGGGGGGGTGTLSTPAEMSVTHWGGLSTRPGRFSPYGLVPWAV